MIALINIYFSLFQGDKRNEEHSAHNSHSSREEKVSTVFIKLYFILDYPIPLVRQVIKTQTQ